MSARLSLLSLVAEVALQRGRQRLVRKLILLALAAMLGFLALTAALVAAGLGLATLVPPVQAALILAAGLALLALILVLLARGGRDPLATDRLMDEAGRLVGAVQADMRERPIGLPLAGAALAGLILGLRLFGRR